MSTCEVCHEETDEVVMRPLEGACCPACIKILEDEDWWERERNDKHRED